MLDKLFNKLSSRRDDKYIEIKNTPKKYVIIGASAAGINAGKVLRKLDPNSNITIISKDNKIYSRCMLHHIISNHRSVDSINFVDVDFMDKNNIIWIKNTIAKSIDTKRDIINEASKSNRLFFTNFLHNFDNSKVKNVLNIHLSSINKIRPILL